jgi:hypothetical protein
MDMKKKLIECQGQKEEVESVEQCLRDRIQHNKEKKEIKQNRENSNQNRENDNRNSPRQNRQ